MKSIVIIVAKYFFLKEQPPAPGLQPWQWWIVSSWAPCTCDRKRRGKLIRYFSFIFAPVKDNGWITWMRAVSSPGTECKVPWTGAANTSSLSAGPQSHIEKLPTRISNAFPATPFSPSPLAPPSWGGGLSGPAVSSRHPNPSESIFTPFCLRRFPQGPAEWQGGRKG